MSKFNYGQCHLCGETAKLTFEHVPPRKAFNQHKALMYMGKHLLGRDRLPWELSGIKGREQQGGIGAFTLCGRCNNNTGSWYAASFVDFVYQGYEIIRKIEQDRKLGNKEWLEIKYHDIYPLRIIKQVIAMFFSVNTAGLSTVHPDLKAFVLNKDKRGLSADLYGIYLYVLRGIYLKRIGLCSILNVNTGSARILSEISAPPYGYVFEIKPKHFGKYCNIINYASEFAYEDKVQLTLKIPIYECNTYFPADYRTREEVMNDYIKNKLWEINNPQ